MGYWGCEILDNDHTLDWVDKTSQDLLNCIKNVESSSVADFYNAATFIRGVKSVADMSNAFVPLSVFELCKTFIRNCNSMKIAIPDTGFHKVLDREAAWIRQEIVDRETSDI